MHSSSILAGIPYKNTFIICFAAHPLKYFIAIFFRRYGLPRKILVCWSVDSFFSSSVWNMLFHPLVFHEWWHMLAIAYSAFPLQLATTLEAKKFVWWGLLHVLFLAKVSMLIHAYPFSRHTGHPALLMVIFCLSCHSLILWTMSFTTPQWVGGMVCF